MGTNIRGLLLSDAQTPAPLPKTRRGCYNGQRLEKPRRRTTPTNRIRMLMSFCVCGDLRGSQITAAIMIPGGQVRVLLIEVGWCAAWLLTPGPVCAQAAATTIADTATDAVARPTDPGLIILLTPKHIA